MTAIDRLSVIWKSNLTDKMKRSFFQAAAVSILLYGCTTWTLTKRMEKRLDGNYTRMLEETPQKTYLQSRKLSKFDEPDMQDTAGEAGTSLLLIFSDGPTHMAEQMQGDQLEPTYSSSVRIQDVAPRTCQKRWTIGRSDE